MRQDDSVYNYQFCPFNLFSFSVWTEFLLCIMADFCPSGLWPAVQALIAFLVSNVFAHAASIHLPEGADARTALIAILSAIVTPFALGSNAFRVIDRARRRFSFRLRKASGFKGLAKVLLTPLFSGDALDNAVVAGALAIRIPPEYKGLTRSWTRVHSGQRLISPAPWGYTDTRVDVIRDRQRLAGYFVPWLQFDDGCEDLFVVLPPDTTFKDTEGIRYVIILTSTLLPQIIAIIQLVLSSRQIYLNYDSSVITQGLSSPYLCVSPYLLMTFINFIANAVAGSYPQVIVLPKARTTRGAEKKHDSETDIRSPNRAPQTLHDPGSSDDGFFSPPHRLPSFLAHLEDETHIPDLEEERFRSWLRQNYPFLRVDDFTFPKQLLAGSSWSSIFLIPAATLIIGFVTHFHAANRTRAAWFLIWLYGMPVISLAHPMAERRWPQRKAGRHLVVQAAVTGAAVVFGLVHLGILIGIFGGTAVIAVGLLEAMCESSWSFTDSTWLKIGFTTFLVVTIIYFVICGVFGIPSTYLGLPDHLLMRRVYPVLWRHAAHG